MYQNRWNEKCEIYKSIVSEVEEIFQITNEAQQAIIFKILISRVKEISWYNLTVLLPIWGQLLHCNIARERGGALYL